MRARTSERRATGGKVRSVVVNNNVDVFERDSGTARAWTGRETSVMAREAAGPKESENLALGTTALLGS